MTYTQLLDPQREGKVAMHRRSLTESDVYKQQSACTRTDSSDKLLDQAGQDKHQHDDNLIKQAAARLNQRQSREPMPRTSNEMHIEALNRQLQARQIHVEPLHHAKPGSVHHAESLLPKISTVHSLPYSLSMSPTRASSPFSFSGDDISDTASTVASTASSTWDLWFAEAKEQQRRERLRRREERQREKNQGRMSTDAQSVQSVPKSPSIYSPIPTKDHIYTSPLSTDLFDRASVYSFSSRSHRQGFHSHPPVTKARKEFRHPLSPSTSVPLVSGGSSVSGLRKKDAAYNRNRVPDRVDMYSEPGRHMRRHSRNALDDALSFLDSLSENGEDGGFSQDVDHLLHHPNRHRHPATRAKVAKRSPLRHDSRNTAPTENDQTTSFFPLAIIMNLFSAGLRWCKFLFILCAAMVVSLFNGPQDMDSSY